MYDRILARLYDPVIALPDRLVLKPYRVALAQNLSGTVLEIGAGTGAMLPFYPTAPKSPTLYALEPNPHMRRQGIARSSNVDVDVQWLDGVGEMLPITDSSIDAVVSSMALCTVDDPNSVLAETKRVLRDGGELRVFEHVAANGWQRQIQRGIEPVWKPLTGGCRPNRATDVMITQSGAFEPIEEHRLRVGIPPIRPFHFGRYRKSTNRVDDTESRPERS